MSLDLKPRKNDTSTLLDALRVVASLAVLIGHAISFFQVAPGFRPPHFPYIQNLAVIGFFILSGFLISSVLHRADNLPEYLVDRFSRIYSAYIPSMGFIAALAFALNVWGLNQEEPTIWNWLQNLLMINAYAGSLCPDVCARNFSTAGHLWSLGVEFHIYLFAGFAFFAYKKKSIWLAVPAIFFSKVPVIYMVDADVYPGPTISIAWFAGSLTYLVLSRANIGCFWAAYMIGLGAVVFTSSVVPGREYSLATYLSMAVIFAGCVAVSQNTKFLQNRRLQGLVGKAAGFSFTLYLVHHPIQFAIQAVWPESGFIGATAAILLPIPVSIGIAGIGEKHHKRMSRFIKDLMVKRSHA